jgi:tRNA1Val (adenine37-N6)-methyltransferase
VNHDTHFKGWAKPGPIPPGAATNPDVPADQTLDALSGHFRIYQLRDGHRFSTDDVLTAWYGTTWAPSAQWVLDLGSGIGSVGMIAAWRLPGARFVTIEAQGESVVLARQSAEYNGLLDRYEIRHGDFRDEVRLPSDCAQGIPSGSRGVKPDPTTNDPVKPGNRMLTDEERFDLVLGSPPYFPLGTGIEGDHPQKVACRFELRGDIADYARTAADHLANGGVFTCVFPEEQLERVEHAAVTASLTIVRRRPVVFREGEPPLISLFVMIRSADLPERMRHRTWVEPPLIIRAADGSVHPEYAAVKLAVGFPP